jgi:Fur family zinc uptake transcriptional regulator
MAPPVTGPSDKALSRSQERVLGLVRASAEPTSAYDLLRQMKEDGITAPPVVYRALKALQERGLVHRLESLNAYVACDGPGHRHAGHFAICRLCGRVEETTDPAIDRLIGDWTRRLGFTPERQTLEVLGLCRDCAA